MTSAILIPLMMAFQTAQLINYFQTASNYTPLNLNETIYNLGNLPKASIILISALSTVLLFVAGHFVTLIKPKRIVLRLFFTWLAMFLVNALPVGLFLAALYSGSKGSSNKWMINEPEIVLAISVLFVLMVILCRHFWITKFYDALKIDNNEQTHVNQDAPFMEAILLPWSTGVLVLTVIAFSFQAWIWVWYLFAMSMIIFSMVSRQQLKKALLSFLRYIFQHDKRKYYRIYQHIQVKNEIEKNSAYPDATFDFYDKLSDFVFKKRQKGDLLVFHSYTSISFGRTPFGTKLNDLSSCRKQPTYINYELVQNDVILAHIFQEKFLTRNSRESMVFYNQEFFFGDLTVNKEAVFQKELGKPILTNHDIKQKLIKDISNMYHLDIPFKEDQFIIVDDAGTILWFCDNGFSYQVRYFSSKNPKIRERLHKHFKNKRSSIENFNLEDVDWFWYMERKPELYLSNN